MGIKNEIAGNRVFAVWDEAVGDVIAKNAQPQFFKKGILLIGTTNSVWAQELSLMSQQLIKTLNERLGKDLIKEIKLRATAIEKGAFNLNGETKKEAVEEMEDIELEPEDLREIEVTVEGIKDVELREEIKKLMVADKKRKRQTLR